MEVNQTSVPRECRNLGLKWDIKSFGYDPEPDIALHTPVRIAVISRGRGYRDKRTGRFPA